MAKIDGSECELTFVDQRGDRNFLLAEETSAERATDKSQSLNAFNHEEQISRSNINKKIYQEQEQHTQNYFRRKFSPEMEREREREKYFFFHQKITSIKNPNSFIVYQKLFPLPLLQLDYNLLKNYEVEIYQVSVWVIWIKSFSSCSNKQTRRAERGGAKQRERESESVSSAFSIP
jgi:hypothetical protein